MSKAKLEQLMDWMSPVDALNDRKEQNVIPSAAVGSTLTSGTDTWGSYTEMIATTLADLAIVGVYIYDLSNDDQLHTIEIAIGTTESALITVLANELGAGDQKNMEYVPLPFPIYVPKGSRLAARVSAGVGDTCIVKVATITGIVPVENVARP